MPHLTDLPDLADLTRSHLAAAHASPHGRSAELVLHDGVLRQTVIALTAGSELAEHNSPPAASVFVLAGRVRVTGMEVDEIAAGQLARLTHERHGVVAVEDSAFLLTTVTSLEPAQVRLDDAQARPR
ncbi:MULTISPECIES: cupin [unclassified Actinotalea]|uniref:cupin n=1 Tax=unclassified Actinotalea TaxID=2638618 RepID=UPI002105BD69|nr:MULTISPECIES: cupin [unclassified Actinotalea]